MNLITDAEVSRHLLKYRTPVVTAKGTFTERPTVILAIKDSDGNAGVGEACHGFIQSRTLPRTRLIRCQFLMPEQETTACEHVSNSL